MDMVVVSRRRVLSRSSGRAQNPKKHDLFMFAGEMDVGIKDPVNAHATSYPVMEEKGRYTQSTDIEKRRAASNVTLPSIVDRPQQPNCDVHSKTHDDPARNHKTRAAFDSGSCSSRWELLSSQPRPLSIMSSKQPKKKTGASLICVVVHVLPLNCTNSAAGKSAMPEPEAETKVEVKRELEQAETKLKEAKAELQEAEKKLEKAEQKLKAAKTKTEIKLAERSAETAQTLVEACTKRVVELTNGLTNAEKAASGTGPSLPCLLLVTRPPSIVVAGGGGGSGSGVAGA
jgi:hypothetical protein